jgi:Fe-S-cluster containining protein
MPCSNNACTKKHFFINTKTIGKEEYCIFIEEETFKCLIYDVRPAVCSNYRCARYVERIARETGGKLESITAMISKFNL